MTRALVIGLVAVVLATVGAEPAPALQGPWSAPVSLSDPGMAGANPQLALSPDGTATAVWTHLAGGTAQLSWTRMSVRAPGGRFSRALDLSAPVDTFSPQLAVGPDGSATTVWVATRWGFSDHGPIFVVQARRRAADGTLGAPIDLSGPVDHGADPKIVVGPDGTTTVLWGGAVAIRRVPDGVFAAPVQLPVGGYQTELAVGADGTTVAVWVASAIPDTSVVQAGIPQPGAGFRHPEVYGTYYPPAYLSATDRTAFDPHVAVAPDGTITAVWALRDGTGSIVQASTRPPRGAFGMPIQLSVPGQASSGPQVAVAPDGTTTAIWVGGGIVQASTRPPGGRFSAPVDLSAPGPAASFPQVAVAADGTATAIWGRSVRSDGRGGVTVQAAFTTHPPTLRSPPRITGTARLGRTLRCKPAAFTGATTLTTTWLRAARPIRGARRTAYAITRKDLGKRIACRTTATGPDGTATSTSRGSLARR